MSPEHAQMWLIDEPTTKLHDAAAPGRERACQLRQKPSGRLFKTARIQISVTSDVTQSAKRNPAAVDQSQPHMRRCSQRLGDLAKSTDGDSLVDALPIVAEIAGGLSLLLAQRPLFAALKHPNKEFLLFPGHQLKIC
ncbi:predicted protein [Uncinocarpus reesii 1704]|uniref:Uncharacterized protein n=1 Tax=Uncinocarpus reesii (strain UAMH 1704) TaxID=336963 RepID=C4JI45_UNCRE|nr:uncharacterized protein UREG_01470 [Uncinocarpus reesii 1704]EEP76621.1 predicted protein [Uncinocarpus reesii 1704]